MECRWEAAAIGQIFALPAAVVDAHLKLCGAAQLKVLLWWSRHGGGDFDAAQCSAAVGLSPVDCLDAMHYWQEAGLVAAEGAAAPMAVPVSVSIPAVPAAPVPAALSAARRPCTVKPDFASVMQAQQEDGDFAALLTVSESRLGRCLSHSDMQTLLYLRDTAGMPTEVILMALEYAVQHGHANMRYIEKTVLGWCDDGITSVQAAEAHLCAMRRRESAAAAVEQLLGLPTRLGLADSRLADKWINEWHIPNEVLLMADEVARKRAVKQPMRYLDTVLEGWLRDGARTAEEVLGLLGKTAGKKAAGTSSLQLDEYEEMVVRFRPQYIPPSDGSEN